MALGDSGRRVPQDPECPEEQVVAREQGQQGLRNAPVGIQSMVMRQTFEHWRHLENLREGFMTIWAAMSAGVLTFIAQTDQPFGDRAFVPALAILTALAGLGLVMTLRINTVITHCEKVLRDDVYGTLGLTDLDFITVLGKDWMAQRKLRIRNVYWVLYAFMLVGGIALTILTALELFSGTTLPQEAMGAKP